MDQLQQLKQFSHVVADTGDIEAVRRFQPQDATTNPSLLLKAAQLPNYRHLVDDALDFGRQASGQSTEQLQGAMDRLAVNFGVELSRIVPGRVSTEVEAARSFDSQATIEQAQRLIQLYQQAGVGRERILIKIAATWEGIQAAQVLEQQGIQCNLTLLFSFAQAVACAQAGVYLISPFVGRILDWYQQKHQTTYASEQDPGVLSVKAIYHYYKRFDIKTIVMGASFRNAEQIRQLAGCDRLTIGPQWLEALSQSHEPLRPQLDDTMHQQQTIERWQLNEAQFRWHLNQDAMATEKLAEGIRLFHQDHQKLHDYLANLL